MVQSITPAESRVADGQIKKGLFMTQIKSKLSEFDRAIFDRILTTAKRKKFSLVKLSKAINKSQNYLSTFRYNGGNIPCSLVFQIADVLDVDPIYLLTGKQNDNQEKLLRERFAKVILDRKEISYDALCILYGIWGVLSLGNTFMSKQDIVAPGP